MVQNASFPLCPKEILVSLGPLVCGGYIPAQISWGQRGQVKPAESPPMCAGGTRRKDRPSTPPIPRGCLLTPCGSGPVVSLHARARTLPTRTRTRHAPLARTTRTHLASSDSTCEPARFPACALARALAQPLAQHGHLHAPPTTSPRASQPTNPPPSHPASNQASYPASHPASKPARQPPGQLRIHPSTWP